MAFDHTKAHRAAQMMDKAGGDFVGALAKAFFKADMTNARKMYDAYSDYFDLYYQLWHQDNKDHYETSVEFTEDLLSLPKTIESVYVLLDSAKFRSWMRDTEQNYNTDHVLRKYHKLREESQQLLHAAQAFTEALIELDEPK
jgi:hypothetical protein